MCPSRICPHCQVKALHRGTCENCSYNPLASEIVCTRPEVLLANLDVPRVKFAVYPDFPFPQITFTSDEFEPLQNLMYALGFHGQSWDREGADMFEPDHVYGFDLVKQNAVPFIDSLRALQPS